jgi:hypothetical protein
MQIKSNNINSKKNNTKEKSVTLSKTSLSISSFKTLTFNLSNNIQDNSKIILRIKPKTEDEYLEQNKIYEIKDNNILEYHDIKNNSKIFQFDYIFNEDSSQNDIFNISAKEICDSLFEGYNGTIFTYGQIGSGKTYTMLGPDYTKSFLLNSNFSFNSINSSMNNTNNNSIINNNIFQNKYIEYMKKKEEEGKGIIPRAIEYLLEKKDELCYQYQNLNVHIDIFCSFYEIFNDQIYDLFNNANWINYTPSQFKDKPVEGVLKENLKKIKLNDKKEVFDLIKLGSLNRQSFSQIMNTKSRSHAIFSININLSKMENEDGINIKSILNLVDLAGIEKQKSVENIGERLKDTGKINKALLGLGNVIHNFGENFIPYRDTKLTFLLKESLNVNPKTCLIATISTLKKNMQETLFTLNFTQKIKKIKNKFNNNKNIISKKNKLFDEKEPKKILTKDEIKKEEEIYKTSKEEIINLVNILQQLGENCSEINKFKEKFIQNSLIKKYLTEEYEQSYRTLMDKNKEIENLIKENEIFENKINNLSIELIIKEQTYNNLTKKNSLTQSEFTEIKKKFENVYELWIQKSKTLEENNTILKNSKQDEINLIKTKKENIEKNNEIINNKNDEITNLENDMNNMKDNIANNSDLNVEFEKQIQELKSEIEILDKNYFKAEKDLLTINEKLLDNNTELVNVDNILTHTQKIYKNKLLNNKGDISKLNSLINKSTSNEIESKNRIFLIKNKIIEYDLYLKILNKTKQYLNTSLSELENKNNQYLEKLNEKINTYNNLNEINKDLKNKIDILNKKFELIGGNKKNFKENETKSRIIKLKEENNILSNEVNHLENILGNLYVKNDNIFQYHQNLDKKINEYKKIFNQSQKDLIPIIEKNELRKSLTLLENIRNMKNKKENEKLYNFTLCLENAICLLQEKEELIKNMKEYNENMRLKTISSVRENNVKTTDFNLIKNNERRNSFNLPQTNNSIK